MMPSAAHSRLLLVSAGRPSRRCRTQQLGQVLASLFQRGATECGLLEQVGVVATSGKWAPMASTSCHHSFGWAAPITHCACPEVAAVPVLAVTESTCSSRPTRQGYSNATMTGRRQQRSSANHWCLALTVLALGALCDTALAVEDDKPGVPNPKVETNCDLLPQCEDGNSQQPPQCLNHVQ
eukprot:scaffold375_cov378-Prasinococcus_capsulatus_cf.AAC.18